MNIVFGCVIIGFACLISLYFTVATILEEGNNNGRWGFPAIFSILALLISQAGGIALVIMKLADYVQGVNN